MKQFNVMLVREDQTSAMERVLNMFRIGLNEWDRTRVLYYQGYGYVNYTIVCTEEVFTSIKDVMNQV